MVMKPWNSPACPLSSEVPIKPLARWGHSRSKAMALGSGSEYSPNRISPSSLSAEIHKNYYLLTWLPWYEKAPSPGQPTFLTNVLIEDTHSPPSVRWDSGEANRERCESRWASLSPASHNTSHPYWLHKLMNPNYLSWLCFCHLPQQSSWNRQGLLPKDNQRRAVWCLCKPQSCTRELQIGGTLDAG